jgi:hypothetical protein
MHLFSIYSTAMAKNLSPSLQKRANPMLNRSQHQDYEIIEEQGDTIVGSRSSVGESRNTLVFHRQSVDADDAEHEEDVRMSPGGGSLGQGEQGYSLGFYTEREYNNNSMG